MDCRLRKARILFLSLLLFWGMVSSGLFGQEESVFSWAQHGDSYNESQGQGLYIRSSPSGARVYIDGINRGRTPLKLENMKPGRYYIRLTRDGYRDRNFRVTLRPGSLLEIGLEMEQARGRVFVNVQAAQGGPKTETLPLIPRYSADGKIIDGPLLSLAAGWRTIKVESFGWEEASASVYVYEDSTRNLEFYLKPAEFRLSSASAGRKRFNPYNSGSLGMTELGFEVSAPGRGNLVIRNRAGEIVFSRELGPFRTWVQSIEWDGRDIWGNVLADGMYTCIINTQSIPWDNSAPREAGCSLDIQIDSSMEIFPLTISSGKAGLLYAPFPDLLPRNSFQFEGSLLFGFPPETGDPWNSLPFAGSFRFSLLKSLEFGMVLNMVPFIDKSEDTLYGFAASAKWTMINPAESRMGRALNPGLAAGFAYSWNANTAVNPFGSGTGFELFIPFSLNTGPFSFLLSPSVLWTGVRGFPLDPIPRLILCGGILYKGEVLCSGLSVRSEFIFSGDESAPVKSSMMMGGEIKLFPPPSSNVIFSLMGGIWTKEGAYGGFGGVGIGWLY